MPHQDEGWRLSLPQYQCHKVVGALHIRSIELARIPLGDDEVDVSDLRGAIIIPAESGFPPFRVSPEFLRKHRPQVGGLFVVYDDGWKSFIPEKDFKRDYDPLVTTNVVNCSGSGGSGERI